MITMEKIDYVMNVTHVPYEVVRKYLLECDGDVDLAINKIREEYDDITHETSSENKKEFVSFEDIKNAIHDIWIKGNASKLVVEKNGEIVLSLPLTVSALGVVLAPFASLIGTGVVLIDDFDFKIILKDGKEIDIKDYINLGNPFKKPKSDSESENKEEKPEEDNKEKEE